MIHTRIFAMFVMLIIVIPVTNAVAQIPVKLGIRGGLNIANCDVTNFGSGSDFSSLKTIGLGIVAEIGLSDLVYIQAEPRYIQKGAKVSYSSMNAFAKANFNYLEFPISVKAQFNTSVLKPYIFAGPTLSFLLSAETEFEFFGQKNIINRKDETSSTEFSLDFGAGVEYEITPIITFTGDIRYTLGLTQIYQPGDPNDKITWRSRDVKIFAGILYTL